MGLPTPSKKTLLSKGRNNVQEWWSRNFERKLSRPSSKSRRNWGRRGEGNPTKNCNGEPGVAPCSDPSDEASQSSNWSVGRASGEGKSKEESAQNPTEGFASQPEVPQRTWNRAWAVPKNQTSRTNSKIRLDRQDEGRVLVFATRRNLEILGKCGTWFLDGTLKVCPKTFVQIFGTISRGKGRE